MKKPLLLTFTLIASLLFAGRGLAQAPHADSARLQRDSSQLQRDSARLTDTARAATAGSTAYTDDGFDPAPFAVFLVFVAIIIGAGIVAAIVIGVLLAGVFILATAGILSAGVLVGLYRRSVTAGFKTALLLVCSFGGLLVGGVGFYGVNRYFHLHFPTRTALLTGAGGGLISGLLLGLIVFALIRGLLKLLKQKMAF